MTKSAWPHIPLRGPWLEAWQIEIVVPETSTIGLRNVEVWHCREVNIGNFEPNLLRGDDGNETDLTEASYLIKVRE